MAAVNYMVAIKPPNKIYTTFQALLGIVGRDTSVEGRGSLGGDLLWTPRNGTSVVNVVSREAGKGEDRCCAPFFSPAWEQLRGNQSLNSYRLCCSLDREINNNFDLRCKHFANLVIGRGGKLLDKFVSIIRSREFYPISRRQVRDSVFEGQTFGSILPILGIVEILGS